MKKRQSLLDYNYFSLLFLILLVSPSYQEALIENNSNLYGSRIQDKRSEQVSFPTSSVSRDHLKKLLNRRINDDYDENQNPKSSSSSVTERQSSSPGTPVHAVDYPDLKGKFGYFPPSMFRDYMSEAREKAYNTLYGTVDSKGIFHPANSMGNSLGNQDMRTQTNEREITGKSMDPYSSSSSLNSPLNSPFLPPSHNPSSIKIGETPATAASRDQSNNNPNSRIGMFGSMLGYGHGGYGGGMYPPYFYPPFMGGYGGMYGSMYPYGGYGMAAYNPYMMGMYGGYGGYGGYPGYGYGSWYRSGSEEGKHGFNEGAAASNHGHGQVNLGGGIYPNNSLNPYGNHPPPHDYPPMNTFQQQNGPPYPHQSHLSPHPVPHPMPPYGMQPQQMPPRDNYFGHPSPFMAAASSSESELVKPNEKPWNQTPPPQVHFPYSYTLTSRSNSSSNSPLRHHRDFKENKNNNLMNSNRNGLLVGSPPPAYTPSPQDKQIQKNRETLLMDALAADNEGYYSGISLSNGKQKSYYSPLESVGYFGRREDSLINLV